MSAQPYKRVLLGPQRPVRNLGDAVVNAGIPDGPIAVISAGWQEAEGDIDDVRELIGRPLVDVQLYRRAETLLSNDPDLHQAYRARQDRLQELQGLYRRRLRQLAIAAREMLRADGDVALVASEQRHAIAQLRALDRHHQHNVEAIYREFENSFDAASYGPIAENASEIARTLAECEALLITGGNVVIMMNRVRLFGISGLLRDKHLIAWSAGAMLLADRIVLFHDRTPQGGRDAEILSAGTGVLPGYVFLPNANRRLRKKDELRTGLFSRRFAPNVSVTLDSGSALHFEGRKLKSVDAAQFIKRTGRLGKLRAA